MPSVKVIVKWSGKKYDLELNTDEPVEIFKSQIYTLTEVSPDRQKLLSKGLILKDDSDLNTLNIKEGHTFMMMGTIGELPSEPPQKTLFIEDMSDRQKAETLKLPSGFINLGNTCYMNATLQCLRAIPELQESLNKSKITSGGEQYNQNMALSLRELYNQLNQTTEGYPPSNFLETLRTAFPQFAQRNSVDGYMQQDADECWSQIISSISDVGLTSSGEGSSTSSRTQGSFVEQYMTGEYTSILKCMDNDALDEEPGVSHETFNKLNCHISTVVDDVMRGITEVLDEVLLKNSPTLNREAKYSKKSRISRLPSYLTVHFVRFFWKSQQRVRSKILRKVRFPFDLDVTDLCTDELKKKISPVRDRIIELEKERIESKRITKLTKNPDQKEVENIKKKDDSSIEEIQKLIDPDLVKDVGSNVTGLYELSAVLTHIGRSADGGHYVAWVRKDDNSDKWVKYDDDRVSIVNQEEILKLDGGGDWHIAYILLYRSKKIA